MKEENFKRKDYLKELTLSQVRMKFKLKTQMYEAKFNYKNDPKNKKELWKCHSCQSGEIESQSHILYCEAYKELRQNRDINNDKDLIEYMRGVLTVREKLQINK